jgi:hypothetical protein
MQMTENVNADQSPAQNEETAETTFLLVRVSVSSPWGESEDKELARKMAQSEGMADGTVGAKIRRFPKLKATGGGKAITKAVGRIRQTIDYWTTPYAARSLHVITADAYDPFMEALEKAIKSYEEILAKYLTGPGVYEEQLEIEKDAAGEKAFNKLNYWSPEEARKRRWVVSSIIPFSSAQQNEIAGISAHRMKQLRDSQKQQVQMLRQAQQTKVEEFIKDKLRRITDFSKKGSKNHKPVLDGLHDFITNLVPKMNLPNPEKFTPIIQKINDEILAHRAYVHLDAEYKMSTANSATSILADMDAEDPANVRML